MRWIKSILIVTAIFGLFSQSGFAVTTAQTRVFLPFVSSEINVPYWFVAGVGKPDSVGKEMVYGYYPKYEVKDIEGNPINTITPPDGEVWLMPTFIPRSKKLVINVKRKTSVGEVWFTRYQDADSNNFYEVPVTGRDVPYGYVSATGQYFAVSICVKSGGCYSIVFDASGQQVTSVGGLRSFSAPFYWSPDGYHAIAYTDFNTGILREQSFDVREPEKIYTTTMTFVGWSQGDKPIVLVDKTDTHYDFYRASYDFVSKQKLFTLSITPDDYVHQFYLKWNGFKDELVFTKCFYQERLYPPLPLRECEYGIATVDGTVNRLGYIPFQINASLENMSRDGNSALFLTESNPQSLQDILYKWNLRSNTYSAILIVNKYANLFATTPDNEYVLIEGDSYDSSKGYSIADLKSVRMFDGKVFSLIDNKDRYLGLSDTSWCSFYLAPRC